MARTPRTLGPGKHGHLKGGRCPPEYWIWSAMIQRCCNPRCREFPYYGGRGSRVCPRWLEAQGYPHFLSDVGARPHRKYTLHRLDNDGDDEPGNVAWADRMTQQRSKRNNRVLTHAGRAMVLTDWAIARGMKPITLVARLRRGWRVDEALTRPVAHRKPHAQWAKRHP